MAIDLVIREPNGRRSRAAKKRIVKAAGRDQNEGLIRRRADFVPREVAADARSESAAGILYHRGMIDAHHLDALERLTALWQRWRRLAQCEGPHPSYDFGLGLVMDDAAEADVWLKTKNQMIEVRNAIRAACQHSQLAMTMLDGICIQNITPPRLINGDDWQIGKAALSQAVNALKDHFNTPYRRHGRHAA